MHKAQGGDSGSFSPETPGCLALYKEHMWMDTRLFERGISSGSGDRSPHRIGTRDKAPVGDLGTRSIRSWRKMLNYCTNFYVKGGRVLTCW